MQKTELVGIQYLRGLCAMAVLIDHAAAMASFDKYFGQRLLDGVLEYGALGVDIFFAISGFIIAIIALSDHTLEPAIDRKTFFWKRFARIVPTMWVAILSYAVLRHIGSTTIADPWAYVRAFLLVPWGDVDPNQIWTLRHEAIFYILFAISFLGRGAMRLLLIAWFVSPLAIALAEQLEWIAAARRDSLPALLFSDVNLDFGAGFLLGVLRLRWFGTRQFRLPVHPFPVLLLLTLGTIAGGVMAQGVLPPVLARLVMAILSGLLVAIAAYAACPRDRLTAFGELLGNASYSIYLFHPHFESAQLAALARLTPAMPVAWVVALVSLTTMVATIIVYFLIEQPLVRFVQRQRPAARERAVT